MELEPKFYSAYQRSGAHFVHELFEPCGLPPGQRCKWAFFRQ
jgi:hypothetical protein